MLKLLLLVVMFKATFGYVDDDIQLRDCQWTSSSTVTGRVAIFLSGHWFPLSALLLRLKEDGLVICRSAGYQPTSEPAYVNKSVIFPYYYWHFDGFKCNGSEKRLQDCPTRQKPKILDSRDYGFEHGFVMASCKVPIPEPTSSLSSGVVAGISVGSISFVLALVIAFVSYRQRWRYRCCRSNTSLLDESMDELEVTND